MQLLHATTRLGVGATTAAAGLMTVVAWVLLALSLSLCTACKCYLSDRYRIASERHQRWLLCMQGLPQDHVCLLAIDSAPIECKEHQLMGRTQLQSCAHHLTAHRLAFCRCQGNSLCLILLCYILSLIKYIWINSCCICVYKSKAQVLV